MAREHRTLQKTAQSESFCGLHNKLVSCVCLYIVGSRYGFLVQRKEKIQWAFNLDKKVALIKEYCDPTTKVSYEALAKKYNIGKSSVCRIIGDSKTHLANYDEKNLSVKRFRKIKKTGNSDLNVLMKEWFDAARAKSIPMSGPLLQEQALKYAVQMGLQDFQASHGWLALQIL